MGNDNTGMQFAANMTNRMAPAVRALAKDDGKIGVVELIDSLDEILQMSMDSVMDAPGRNANNGFGGIPEEAYPEAGWGSQNPYTSFGQFSSINMKPHSHPGADSRSPLAD